MALGDRHRLISGADRKEQLELPNEVLERGEERATGGKRRETATVDPLLVPIRGQPDERREHDLGIGLTIGGLPGPGRLIANFEAGRAQHLDRELGQILAKHRLGPLEPLDPMAQIRLLHRCAHKRDGGAIGDPDVLIIPLHQLPKLVVILVESAWVRNILTACDLALKGPDGGDSLRPNSAVDTPYAPWRSASVVKGSA